jgi:hypothetical protein
MSEQGPISFGHTANRYCVERSLVLEVDQGLRFCKIVRSGAMSPELYDDGVQRTRLALQHAEEYIWNLHIAHESFDELTSNAERLRFELAQLEEAHKGK